MVLKEESLYVRIADTINAFSKRSLRDPRAFISTLAVIALVVVSTIFFSHKACAEDSCSSSSGCIECEIATDTCEANKNQLDM